MPSAVLTETEPAEAIFREPEPFCEIDADGMLHAGCPLQAIANALCSVTHFPGCPDAANHRIRVWMCRYHLDLARSGGVVCSPCEGPVAVIREL